MLFEYAWIGVTHLSCVTPKDLPYLNIKAQIAE